MIESEAGLDELKSKIHRERGFNTHFYKDKCLRRRFAVRMRARGLEDFGAYADLLDQDPAEFDRLIDTLTINVTKFFRNRETWDAIEREVVPRLFDDPRSRHLIWSAGCASGEEPYSVSILLREWAAAKGRQTELERFSILGTDIDRASLEAARTGEYTPLSFDETPDGIRERWFSQGPPHRLSDEARTGVRFQRHDLISDPPIGGQSLILCRNVIIYFDRSVQEQLFRNFFEALVPGGFLVLGRVETLLGPTRGMFRTVSTRERIYRKPG
jgi:chemotaxis protein methyltransferase CheR